MFLGTHVKGQGIIFNLVKAHNCEITGLGGFRHLRVGRRYNIIATEHTFELLNDKRYIIVDFKYFHILSQLITLLHRHTSKVAHNHLSCRDTIHTFELIELVCNKLSSGGIVTIHESCGLIRNYECTHADLLLMTHCRAGEFTKFFVKHFETKGNHIAIIFYGGILIIVNSRYSFEQLLFVFSELIRERVGVNPVECLIYAIHYVLPMTNICITTLYKSCKSLYNIGLFRLEIRIICRDIKVISSNTTVRFFKKGYSLSAFFLSRFIGKALTNDCEFFFVKACRRNNVLSKMLISRRIFTSLSSICKYTTTLLILVNDLTVSLCKHAICTDSLRVKVPFEYRLDSGLTHSFLNLLIDLVEHIDAGLCLFAFE